MIQQLDGELREALGEAAFWDVPQFNAAVIAGRRDLEIVERIPLQVEDLTRVADDLTSLKVDPTSVVQWNHDERSIGLDSEEHRVDRTDVAVLAVPVDANVRVAFLLRRAVNMAELRWPDATKPELKREFHRKCK